jgi:hypothetical protein
MEKPQPFRSPLALPLWATAALLEFLRDLWHGRRPLTDGHDFSSGGQGEVSLSALRRSILGHTSGAIATALGQPRTAVVTRPAKTCLDCDTWYYPLCKEARWCMAITFKKGIARKVEFFCGMAG